MAATLGVVILGKPAAALAIVVLLRRPPKVALAVAVALAQIGEFSFMLAGLGRQLGVLPPGATDTLVGAAIVSITLNPLMYRFVDPFDAWATRRSKLWRKLVERSRPEAIGPSVDPVESLRRAIVIGYGPVGRTVTRLLRENEIEPTVVELNMDTVRSLRESGIAAVYGDATHADTLKVAGVQGAGGLILSSSGMSGSEELIRQARALNPAIRVLARSTYVRELSALKKAGAEAAFSGEGEVALALTVALLRELGATPEQIDRERERVQAELVGDAPAIGYH